MQLQNDITRSVHDATIFIKLNQIIKDISQSFKSII